MPCEVSSEDEGSHCVRCGHSAASHDKLRRHTCIGNRNLCGCEVYDPAEKPSEGCARCGHVSNVHKLAGCLACPGGWRADHSFKLNGPPEGDSCAACGCPPGAHMGRPEGCIPHGFHEYEKPPADAETAGTPHGCGWSMHAFQPFQGPGDQPGEPHCLTCGHTETFCGSHERPESAEEPDPDAPESCDCGNAECTECFPIQCGFSRPEPWDPEPECTCPEGTFDRFYSPKDCAKHGHGPLTRPPFSVAYATGSGDLIELALPGDATVAVADGALVITHPSTVLGIQYVKPLEMEN